jgi:hypothetical protein
LVKNYFLEPRTEPRTRVLKILEPRTEPEPFHGIQALQKTFETNPVLNKFWRIFKILDSVFLGVAKIDSNAKFQEIDPRSKNFAQILFFLSITIVNFHEKASFSSFLKTLVIFFSSQIQLKKWVGRFGLLKQYFIDSTLRDFD